MPLLRWSSSTWARLQGHPFSRQTNEALAKEVNQQAIANVITNESRLATREVFIKNAHRGLWYEDGVLVGVLDAGRHVMPSPRSCSAVARAWRWCWSTFASAR